MADGLRAVRATGQSQIPRRENQKKVAALRNSLAMLRSYASHVCLVKDQNGLTGFAVAALPAAVAVLVSPVSFGKTLQTE